MIPGWQMEAYERLRIEIVRLAVQDLQKAMRKSARLGYVCNEQKRLEAWFRSKWGQLLCEDRGDYILQRCRETYNGSSPKNVKQILPDDVQKQIYEEYRKGVMLKDITKRYGISYTVIYMIVRRWGK